MKFENKDKVLSVKDIQKVETELGLQFPEPLKRLFLENNGGDPDPNVYQNEDAPLDTVVSETLPLVSSSDSLTAVVVYENLVLEEKLIHAVFFPFAVDPGGDYFFVNCEKADAPVYFYDSDCEDYSECLLDLGLGLDAFWESLVTDPDED